MNTSTRANKTLFVAIFLVIATFSGGQIARAQVIDTPATQAQIQDLQATLVSLLSQLIAQLQAQIQALLATQSTQQTQIDTIVQNTTPTPISFGTIATNTPPVIPLRLLAGQAGSITSYLAGKDLSESEKADMAYHGSPVDRSLVNVSANKTLDLSKTELWVGGVKENITTTPYRTVNDGGIYPRQDFYISPNIYSFATKNSDGSYAEKIQLKFGDSDGNQINAYAISCNAFPSSATSYSSPNCNNMPLSQEGY